MRSLVVPCIFSLAAVASARQSPLSLDLGFCGISLFDQSSWNPICTGDRQSLDAGLATGNFQDNIHNAADKPSNVLNSADTTLDDSPWSHRPKCLRLQNSTEKYCIYTSSVFAQNRGVSLFTTQDHGDGFLELPAFKHPDVTRDANREPNPPYESRQLPGRGVGLIANRTLHRGDHIFSNTPVFIINEEVFDTFVGSDRRPFQTEGINRLPEKTRKLFMDLCGHFGGDPVEDIINTNSFAVELFEDDQETSYNVVFPEISVSPHPTLRFPSVSI